MPQLNRQFIEDFAAAPPEARAQAVGQVVTLSGETEWAASPARAMHEQLLRAFGTEEQVATDDWSLRAKFLLIGFSSLALWAAIGAIVVVII